MKLSHVVVLAWCVIAGMVAIVTATTTHATPYRHHDHDRDHNLDDHHLLRRHHPSPSVSRSSSPSSLLPSPSSPSSSVCTIPSGFVHLRDVAPSIIQEMRYATYHNFVGRPVKSYDAPECILTIEAAHALSKVQDFLLSGKADPVNQQSYSLKVYDCYRPTSSVMDFVAWAKNVSDTLMKAEFYPEVDKSDLFSDGYIAYHSGHSRGSTMDLTYVPMPAAPEPIYKPGDVLTSCHGPKDERWKDNMVDMGTGFDCFSPISWTNDSSIDLTAQYNRLVLVSAMKDYGNFVNYDEEWWHYTLINEPFPSQEFDFTVC